MIMNVLAIDIGGTKVKFGTVSHSGKITRSAQFAVERGAKPESVISRIAFRLKEERFGKFSGIGIACAGLMAASGRTVVFSPNLNWRNIPLAGIAEKILGRPARIENDVNAVALGEQKFGAGKGADDLVALFVGTGIGGGIVSGGRLIRGANGFSAEIGHTVFKPDGWRCACGRRGCFETYAGGKYIVCNFHRSGGSRSLKKPSDIYAAAKKGNRIARRVWQDALEALSTLCVNLATTLDTKVIVLGGGVIENCPGLDREIMRKVRRYFTRNWKNCPAIVKSSLGADAALLGAASCAIDALT